MRSSLHERQKRECHYLDKQVWSLLVLTLFLSVAIVCTPASCDVDKITVQVGYLQAVATGQRDTASASEPPVLLTVEAIQHSSLLVYDPHDSGLGRLEEWLWEMGLSAGPSFRWEFSTCAGQWRWDWGVPGLRPHASRWDRLRHRLSTNAECSHAKLSVCAADGATYTAMRETWGVLLGTTGLRLRDAQPPSRPLLYQDHVWHIATADGRQWCAEAEVTAWPLCTGALSRLLGDQPLQTLRDLVGQWEEVIDGPLMQVHVEARRKHELQLEVTVRLSLVMESVAAVHRTAQRWRSLSPQQRESVRLLVGPFGSPKELFTAFLGRESAASTWNVPVTEKTGVDAFITSVTLGRRQRYALHLHVPQAQKRKAEVLTCLSFPLALVHPMFHAMAPGSELVASVVDEPRGLQLAVLRSAVFPRFPSSPVPLASFPVEEVWLSTMHHPPDRYSPQRLSSPVSAVTYSHSSDVIAILCSQVHVVSAEVAPNSDLDHSHSHLFFLQELFCNSTTGKGTNTEPLHWARATSFEITTLARPHVVLRTRDDDCAIISFFLFIFLQFIVLPISILRITFSFYAL